MIRETSARQDMNSRTMAPVGRVPVAMRSRLATAAMCVSLIGCASSPEYRVVRSTEATIRAEDVQEIAIQEVRARERAGREASRCGASTRSQGGCEDDRRIEVEQIFGPDADFE